MGSSDGGYSRDGAFLLVVLFGCCVGVGFDALFGALVLRVLAVCIKSLDVITAS